MAEEDYGTSIRKIPAKDNTEYRDIDFQGTPLVVSILKPGKPAGDDESPTTYNVYFKMVIQFPSDETRESFILFLQSLLPTRKEIMERPNKIYRSRAVGGWNHVTSLSKRNLDSLILPNGMMDDLLKDIESFLGNETKYVDRGIPYHRGYLLYGPPGTGKSSTIAALGAHIKRDVHFMSLSAVEGDNALIECVSTTGAGILVLEDIDVFAAAHDRDEEESTITITDSKTVTLHGLLNAIDGIMTPHGLITFMTTNKQTVLDKALLRPGRVDQKLNLGFMDQDQLDRMVARFVGSEFIGIPLVRRDVSPAEIVECLKAGFDYEPRYVAECIERVVGLVDDAQ